MWLWPLRAPHAYRCGISFSCFQCRWWEKCRGCRSAACQQDDHSHSSSKGTERRGGKWWEAGRFGAFRTAILRHQFSLFFSFRVLLYQLTNNELISVPVVYPCEHGRMHTNLCYSIWVKLHFSSHAWLALMEGNCAFIMLKWWVCLCECVCVWLWSGGKMRERESNGGERADVSITRGLW